MDAWLNDFHYLPEIQERLMTRENLRWLYETFYAMIYDLDRRVGELLGALEGNQRDTVVIFTSDHGDMMGHRGMVQKRYFYEKSVRVPLIFACPERWTSGRRQETLVSLLDLFPTLAELARAPAPADLPGMSLLPALTGDMLPDDRTVYAEYHGEGVHAPCFMGRRRDCKYMYVHGHEERLYDLRSDPGEETNLASDSGWEDERRSLQKALLERFDPAGVARAARTSQRNRTFLYRCLTRDNRGGR